MKPGLQVGDHYEFSIEVREEMQAAFDGRVIHPLYSTASMINHMEWAARQHILPYLEAGEEGAGLEVHVRHLGTAPVGSRVNIRATVSESSPQRVISRVEAWHDTEKIGEGSFTQAIVPVQKLYAKLCKREQPAPEAEAPPPAVLLSLEGQTRFELALLKWETGLFPCTRYDEWLICEAVLQAHGHTLTEKGPFLLRYEVEEWLQAVQALLSGDRAGYQSDYLEPYLRVQMTASGPAQWQAIVAMQALSASGARATQPHQAAFTLNLSALQAFADALALQLEGFPSKL